MRGALLRSGKSGAFTALGETGQPVYRAALQLREAIRRKNPDMALHLAVPQSDELGDNIDWYSDVPGDVVPWGSATEEERAPARAQLEAFKAFLTELSTTLLSADANKTQSDKVVFAKLLTRVISFPDESFVYLVNGKPVLAFWGFVHPNADRFLDPLYCLYPRTQAPVTPPLASVAPEPAPAPQPVPVPVVVKRPWWKWLLWLLLLLLLLFLLLFGLRSCSPSVALPGGLALPTQWPNLEMPQVLKPIMGKLGFGNGVSAPGNGVGGSLPAPESGGNEPAPEPDANADGNLPPELPDANTPPEPVPDVAEPSPPEATTPPETPTPPVPPVLPDEQPATDGPQTPAVPGPPLSIPADAADGQADFLNGRFRAGAGIQDKTTGKSLRLEYQFKDGKGEVIVRKANGINCTGPVTASMNSGNLSINSQGQAACGDGSSYEMPKVDCRQGAKSIADCNGIYEDKQFPITMRQMGE